eukprot:scaffold3051_cov236-Pinguiococcus_pyrenoidosus.AAC.10
MRTLHDRVVRGLERLQRKRTEVLLERGAHRARVHQLGNACEDLALLADVVGLEHGPSEHELPMQRDALQLEREDVEALGVVHQAEARLRLHHLDKVRQMLVRSVHGNHVIQLADAQSPHLRAQLLAVIHHVVRAQLLDPSHRLRPRRRRDHGELRLRLGGLDEGGADAARRAQQQDGGRALLGHLQAVEQQLVGREGRERQRRGLDEGQAAGFLRHDGEVHELQRRVGAVPRDVAGVVHLVSRLEALHVGPHLADHAGGVVAQHVEPVSLQQEHFADLGVGRVEPGRAHLHQQVPGPGAGHRQLLALELVGAADLGVSKGLHLPVRATSFCRGGLEL